MTISTLVLKAPVDLNSLPDHPALDFYAKYGKDFQEHFHTCDPEKYYNANCLMYAVDRAKMHGASTMWNFFGTLYADFPHVSREWISMIIVSDDEAGRHTIHAEMLTTVYPQGKEHRGIVIPQSFVYVLGKAVSVNRPMLDC